MVKLLYFSAEWCGPCNTQSPIVDEIKDDVDSVEVVKIDIDESQDVATEYQVRSLPTIIIVSEDDDGEKTIHDRFTGVTQKETLEDAIEEAI